MYKPCWMSVPLIVMLTACGSDDNSNSDTTPDPKVDKKSLTFVGNVYDGPIADATVSVYAGTQLLASGKTNADGKYVINASIKNSEFEKIKSHPITYKAIRDDIILHEYDGRSLEQAFNNKKNSALISNFSTVEYVLADTDKNDFVSSTEWDLYLTFDRNYTEPLIIRYGAGLKAIIDNSASLGGYKNTILWLRALRDEEKWNNWHTQNTSQYKQAWDALFADKWFLEQEKHRFKDISSWEVKYDDITTPDFTKPTIYNLSISGIPETASIGDKVFPTAHALFTNMTSKNVSSETVYAITPTDALENKGTYWEVKKAGYISIKAQYGDIITTETIAVDMGDTALTSITLSGVGKSVTVGDKITPTISANWSNGTVSDVTSLSDISYSPENAIKLENGQAYIAAAGDINLSASYMDETSTIKITAQEAVLTELRLGFNQREQLFNKQFQVSAEGIHENDYIIDFTNEATWVSSDSTIVESLGNGLFIGKGVGTATITATVGENTVTQDFEVITELLDLSLNLPNNAISREETLQLTLNGEYSDGSVSVISEDIAWASSNPEILTIDENGIAVGIIEGESVVTATYKEMVLEETIEVIAPKIVSSEPPFDLVARNGTMLLSEGGSYPYRFKFTRSNGKEYVFVAEKGGLDFEWSGFREAAIDESGIQIADNDEGRDLMRAVRAGDTKLKLQKVPVELQKIFAELGVDVSVGSSPQAVELSVNIADNADVYQWHRKPVNDSIQAIKDAMGRDELELIQATQSGDTLYRFWQIDGLGKNGPLYLTKITSEGESEASIVDLPTDNFRLIRSRMMSSSNGYIFLLTSNEHSSGVDEHKAYRYSPSNGELAAVDMSPFRDNMVNRQGEGFFFAADGRLIRIYQYDNDLTITVFDFETSEWSDHSKIEGKIIQLASSHDQVGLLDLPTSRDNYFTPPVLRILDLNTLEISEQEFTYPGDSTYTCSSAKSVSIAVRESLQNSGAGCLITDEEYKNAVGYWLWDSIAEEPQLHLFEAGDVINSGETYGVASVKPDGHILYSAGKRKIEEGSYTYYFDVAEIVDVEVEGVIEQQIKFNTIKEAKGDLYSKYSRFQASDGNVQTISNPDAPNEIMAIFQHGITLRGKDGNWNTDEFVFGFPTGHTQKNFHIGDTLVLSHEEKTDDHYQTYWQLQLRKPPVDPVEPTDPNPTPAQ
ncbi:Ig-like domain-containing protein [Photobacterium sanguinicancri]|uniref:Cell surface protein n=1 Tax=Photobacterium sanguinicancri TaxID=875932 RepID=A0AAW7Y4E4_9GAMM|nr:cell surface protein [Photobacterium sanguinicancri]MDO6542651.1 cell surface protein [Photobacterium sanguinicancri]